MSKVKAKNDKQFGSKGELTPEEKKIASHYKRIGTKYYLYSTIPTAKKEPVKILKPWTKTFIIDDYGRDVYNQIEKFIEFVLVPDNTINYKRKIGGCYNLYEPNQFKPKAGEYNNTSIFLNHIFGDYFNIGIDYLTILFTKPAEKLPALCLVSKEQKTGKSTFLEWLCKFYGDNAVILGNEDFASNFNTSWASKLIVGIDESFIEKKEVKEKIKRLVTANSILAEQKGVDKARRDFIGKFILLSNNEENFIQMDKEDSRFFVLKIPTVQKEDPYLLDKLIDEVPAFLNFLQNRKINHQKESRLWFKSKDYETEALRLVVKSSKAMIEKILIYYLSDLSGNMKAIKENESYNEIKITPKRLSEAIKNDVKFPTGLHLKIAEILKSWNLKSNKKSERYNFPIFEDINIQGEIIRDIAFNCETGMYYTIPFSLIDSLNN